MKRFNVLRYLDADGNLVGYRADSLGSLRKDWGKVFNADYDSARNLFNRLKTREKSKHSGHETLSKLLSGVNKGASGLVKLGDSKGLLENAQELQLLELTGFDGFNDGSYGKDDFKKLLENSVVVDSCVLQKD